MTAALKIPENYAEQLPKTIAELKAQQKYFNQLEIAAQKIQEATEKYNKLLEEGLTAIPSNNIDYKWEKNEISENKQQVENSYSQEEIEENQYNQNPEIENQDYEQSSEEEQTETNEYPQNDTKNLEETSNNQQEETEEILDENPEGEIQTQWPKINLSSLLHKDNNEEK